MPLNTTASLAVLAARRHLQALPRPCEIFHQTLEVSNPFLNWLIAQESSLPFLKVDLLRELLPLDRAGRQHKVPQFYEALGFDSWSHIDSNTKYGGRAMDFNLSLARDYGFTDSFDFVDNNGSTEHVFDQRAAFENIHQLCRKGGIMLHKIPTLDVLNIALFGVTPVFFHDLALANDYEILDFRIANRWGDTIPVRLKKNDPAPVREFTAALPAVPGFARGMALEGPGDDQTVPPHEVPPELWLPDFLELHEVLEKAPLPNLASPLSNAFHRLLERARLFRPDNPGELYSLVLFRKVSDAPFRVPYQSKFLRHIEPPDFRERYRAQFHALGISLEEKFCELKIAASADSSPVAAPQTVRLPFLEVAESNTTKPDPRLLGFALDSPPAGFRADEYSIDISGWLVGKSARAMGVKVTCGSEIVRQTDVWLPRPDIEDLVSRKLQKETFLRRFVRSLGRRRGNKLIEEAAASGFHASVNLLGLPEKFKLRVRGLLADGTRVELGEIKGRHLPVRTSCLNKFQPLILSGLGRSGSSWLIHLIGEHPGIITHLSHPYISRVAVHAMRVFQVQSTPSNPVRTKEMRGTTWETQSVSSLPLLCRTIDPAGESWLRKNRVELLAAQTQEMIEEFYAQVAMRQKKSQARFFAEKVFLYPFIGQLFANLYPSGREIFLVRDFRDVACSRQKFHARRPGREKLSHEHHVKNTAVRAKLLLEHWKARRSRAHLVRYEDLVLRPAETLGSLFEYLELENAPAMIASIIERAAQNTPGLDRHRTIDDATRTIGRWRHDLTPDLQRLCETQCSDALREFGYLEGC